MSQAVTRDAPVEGASQPAPAAVTDDEYVIGPIG